MATQIVHVDGQGGRIWTKPPCPQTDGLLSIIQSAASHRATMILARFNARGDKFTIGDSRGNIYQFHVLQNRYSLIHRAGICPTAMTTSCTPHNVAVVAFEDNIIRAFDTESALLLASLKGHRFQVSYLSFSPNGDSLASTSKDRVIVWDARDWRRKRTLETTSSPLVQTTYGPSGSVIFTSVASEGVIAWHASTFKMLYQLGKSDTAGDVTCFAVSSDCRYLLTGNSQSPLLHLWELKTTVLLRIAVLPAASYSAMKLQFLSNTDVAVVLVDDGSIVIFNILNLRLLLTIHERTKSIRDFDVAPGGRYCTCLMNDGSISLYDLNRALETESIVQKARMKKNGMDSGTYDILKSMPINVHSERVLKKDGFKRAEDSKDDGYDSDRGKADTFSHRIGSPVGSVLLDPLKLKSLLKTHGEYPAEYRPIIWKILLQLPENHDQFNSYLSRGLHPALKNFHTQYPLQDRRLLRRLCQVLSALFYWSPLFSEVDYLPAVVFPFLRIYPADNNVVFETVIVLLLNWGRHWFEFFPNPPVLMLKDVERLLEHQDQDLFAHLRKHEVDSSRYAWPLIRSLFTEALPKSEWLILFDHIISNKASFIIFIVVTYLCQIRKALLTMTCQSHIERFVVGSNILGSSVARLIQDGYRLRKSTLETLIPNDEPWIALHSGFYPEFENYPRFIENFQLQERERIQTEVEAELHSQTREMSLESERAAWKQQQDAYSSNLTKKRFDISENEEMLRNHKSRQDIGHSDDRVDLMAAGSFSSSMQRSSKETAQFKELYRQEDHSDNIRQQITSIGGLRAEFRTLLEKRNGVTEKVEEQSETVPEDVLLQDEDSHLDEQANRILRRHQHQHADMNSVSDLELP